MSIRKVHWNQMRMADKDYYRENGCLVISGLYSCDEISAALDSVCKEFNQNYGHVSREIQSIEANFSQSKAEWNLYRSAALLAVNNLLTNFRE